MSKRVVVVLATGFEEIEAVTPIDVLRRAGLEVLVVGVGSGAIEGSHGITLECDRELADVDFVPDAIVLPGGLPGAANLGKSAAVREMSQAVHDAGGVCAAICAAPALTFAPFGLLNGRTATCYPSFEQEFDSTTTHSQDRVVVDGNVVTSRGPGTALEFSLRLVELLAESGAAAGLQRQMLALVGQ